MKRRPRWANTYDGMVLSTPTPDGGQRLYVVFNPKWWQLGRWLRWLFARGKGRTTIALAAGNITVRILRYYPPAKKH